MNNYSDAIRYAMAYIWNIQDTSIISTKDLPRPYKKLHNNLKIAGFLKLVKKDLKTGEFQYSITREGKRFGRRQFESNLRGNIMSITIYSSENCPNCELLKEELSKLKYSYQEKEINSVTSLTEFRFHSFFPSEAPVVKLWDQFLESKEIISNGTLTPKFLEMIGHEC